MGHLLKTVNPEAADRYVASISPVDVGDVVVYSPRTGERRAGRSEFPATVMRVHENGSADLLVTYDADDLISKQRIPMRTDEQPLNAWRLRSSQVSVEPFEPSRLNGMSRDLAALKEAVLGDFEAPPKSVMDVLDDFGRRLKALEKSAAKTAVKASKAK